MDNNNNKYQGIVLIVALIATASLLSLGAVAATTITSAYAEGDHDDDDGKNRHDDGKNRHDDWNGDGVKQKAKSEADCGQENEADGDGATQTNSRTGGPEVCVSVAANINVLRIGSPVLMDSIGTDLE